MRYMTEAEYIAELKSRWPREIGDEASFETLALVDEAVRTVPNSAKLWVIRGDLIQLGTETSPHSLEDALHSYFRATEIDPEFAEAWESVGHFYDAVLGDEVQAQRYFQEAARLVKRD
jgi:tetratricopeptide (TPR) repeat protein